MNKAIKKVVPAGHIYIRGSVLEKGNIFGVSGEDKSSWAKGLELPKTGEYTFFAGCGYQLMNFGEGMMGAVKRLEKVGMGMDKTIAIAEAFNKVGIDLPLIAGKVTTAMKRDAYRGMLINAVSVLRKLGVDIGYLHEQEPCCGSPVYYSGFVDDYIDNARKTYGLFKSLGIKKIISLVPACTASLRDQYPKFIDGYDLEVKHFLQIVAERLRKGDIKPRLKEKLIVTYHDPCQLSRYLRLFKEPREIMARIEGLELREPEADQRGEWSTCCGGGGGMEIVAPDLCERMSVSRVEGLLATGASIIATSCPACMMQLRKGLKRLDSKVPVVDLAQILDEAL